MKKKTEVIKNDLDPEWNEVISRANISLYSTFHVCAHTEGGYHGVR